MFSSACIIPVVGSTEALEGTLLSVLERRPDDCEVIVVLNTPYDDPFDLHNEIRFIHAPAATGLIGCINLGIAAAAAPIIHVLASGFEAGDGWLEKATAQFANPRVAAVTPLAYNSAEREQLLAAGVGYARGGRRVICKSPPNAQASDAQESIGPLAVAGSYRKAALLGLGGGIPNAVGDELADLDLALVLREAGWHIQHDDNLRVYGSSIEEPRPAGFQSGIRSERLFWHHAKSRGLIAELLNHPFAAISECLRSNPIWLAPLQAFGRLIGLCQFGHYAAQRQLVAAARAQLEAAQHTLREIIPVASPVMVADSAKKQRRVDRPHREARPSESGAAATAPSFGRRRAGS